MNFERYALNRRAEIVGLSNKGVSMKTILFIDRKWQSSVTAYVRVHYEDGSLRHYLQGRYGGSATSESD